MFERALKAKKIPPGAEPAEPHVVFDMPELVRYVLFRERVFDARDAQGDETPRGRAPPRRPEAGVRQFCSISDNSSLEGWRMDCCEGRSDRFRHGRQGRRARAAGERRRSSASASASRSRSRGSRTRTRRATAASRVDPALLTADARALIEDPSIPIVVELIGGLSPAKEFILEALRRGKCVVTANKALLAHAWEEVFGAAAAGGGAIGFEASVGGGIPVIRGLREGLAANRIQSMHGIINGTTNYILSRMTDEGLEYGSVLKKAQELGFAEADPTLDVEGHDAAHKLAILASLAFGTRVRLDQVHTEGIGRVTKTDIAYARELGYVIKLLAIAKDAGGAIEVRVHPTLVPARFLLATVGGAFNAVYVRGDAVGPTLFYGLGAGSLPDGERGRRRRHGDGAAHQGRRGRAAAARGRARRHARDPADGRGRLPLLHPDPGARQARRARRRGGDPRAATRSASRASSRRSARRGGRSRSC